MARSSSRTKAPLPPRAPDLCHSVLKSSTNQRTRAAVDALGTFEHFEGIRAVHKKFVVLADIILQHVIELVKFLKSQLATICTV